MTSISISNNRSSELSFFYFMNLEYIFIINYIYLLYYLLLFIIYIILYSIYKYYLLYTNTIYYILYTRIVYRVVGRLVNNFIYRDTVINKLCVVFLKQI